MWKKLLIFGVLFAAIPVIALAWNIGDPLVPCGTSQDSTPCSLCHLFVLGQNIVDFLTKAIAPSLAVLAFAWAGFKILTSGGSPGARQEGIKIIRNTIIGLLIVFGAWIIIDTLIVFFAGTFFTTSGGARLWNTISCVAPVPTQVVAPTTFVNISSTELSALVVCVKNSVPTLKVTSTTDTNINNGTCNPTDPNEKFNNPDNCQHTKNSCHYGGTNCIKRGSFAFDFGTKSTDPLYDTVRNAILACTVSTGGAYVNHENIGTLNEHGHASIGTANGCGCQ